MFWHWENVNVGKDLETFEGCQNGVEILTILFVNIVALDKKLKPLWILASSSIKWQW